MSVGVSLEELWGKIEEFGDHPYVITSSVDGRPHVVSVPARVEDGCVVVTAGRTTSANVAANPVATLLWAAPAGAPYSLIVDGEGTRADGDADEVAVRPTRAVLHRVAGVAEDVPSCVEVLPRAAGPSSLA